MPDNPTPSEQTPSSGGYQDQVIKGHKYDGIREYDNPMPGWWVAIFWGSVIFAGIYVLGVHVFDFIDTYEEDLAESLEQLETVRTAYAEANPTFEADPATLAEFVGEEQAIEAGAQTYAAVCASCHGAEGGGSIGPNLTDNYWVHGNTNMDMFNVITDGVAAKGMPPWDSALSPEERAQLVAFIQSLEGTDPPNAKEPQGELYE
ncbi:MAG: c-type cytochrome [Bacteroidetes bacterium]|jgi:cytochrome c oxidase cbb3-type subunit 3|nr:c-type cytochrome [Bacteroidota bacterium]